MSSAPGSRLRPRRRPTRIFSTADAPILRFGEVADLEASSLFSPHVGDGGLAAAPAARRSTILMDTACDLQ